MRTTLLDEVNTALSEARKYGLEAEVVTEFIEQYEIACKAEGAAATMWPTAVIWDASLAEWDCEPVVQKMLTKKKKGTEWKY
jgi:hypothetical protein